MFINFVHSKDRFQFGRHTTLNRLYNRQRQVRHNLAPHQTTQFNRGQHGCISRLNRTNNIRTINILRRNGRRVARRRNINNTMRVLRRTQNGQPVTSTFQVLTQLFIRVPSVPFVRQSRRIILTLRPNLNYVSNNNSVISRAIRVSTQNGRTLRIANTVELGFQVMMHVTKSRISIIGHLLGCNFFPLTRNIRRITK